MPWYEHDPCLADLPGVRAACCGHGAEPGYILFENGLAVDFETKDIRRPAPGDPGCSVRPDDERFWVRASA
jgi:hypothetical protein